jgi:hypothetical protein
MKKGKNKGKSKSKDKNSNENIKQGANSKDKENIVKGRNEDDIEMKDETGNNNEEENSEQKNPPEENSNNKDEVNANSSQENSQNKSQSYPQARGGVSNKKPKSLEQNQFAQNQIRQFDYNSNIVSEKNEGNSQALAKSLLDPTGPIKRKRAESPSDLSSSQNISSTKEKFKSQGNLKIYNEEHTANDPKYTQTSETSKKIFIWATTSLEINIRHEFIQKLYYKLNTQTKTGFFLGFYKYKKNNNSKITYIIFKFTHSGKFPLNQRPDGIFPLYKNNKEKTDIKIRAGYYDNDTLLERQEWYATWAVQGSIQAIKDDIELVKSERDSYEEFVFKKIIDHSKEDDKCWGIYLKNEHLSKIKEKNNEIDDDEEEEKKKEKKYNKSNKKKTKEEEDSSQDSIEDEYEDYNHSKRKKTQKKKKINDKKNNTKKNNTKIMYPKDASIDSSDEDGNKKRGKKKTTKYKNDIKSIKETKDTSVSQGKNKRK